MKQVRIQETDNNIENRVRCGGFWMLGSTFIERLILPVFYRVVELAFSTIKQSTEVGYKQQQSSPYVKKFLKSYAKRHP